MKGNCTKLERYNGTGFDVIGNRVSITGPARMRESVEEELTLDCGTEGSSATKKKSPGTKEIGDISVEVIANFTANVGVRQVTTATGAGTVSGAGNALVTITAAGLTGSPLALNVPVTTGAPAVWVPLVRAYLAANPAVAGMFTISGEGAAIILTRKADSDGIAPANDATLNVALATGTATGITTAASSSATAAGVAGFVNPEKHHLFDSDFDNETATFWRVRHANAAASGMIVHGTVKEIGEPSYTPNETVKFTVTIEPTGQYFLKANAIADTVLPSDIIAPKDRWGA